jgi:hypothetical protein
MVVIDGTRTDIKDPLDTAPMRPWQWQSPFLSRKRLLQQDEDPKANKLETFYLVQGLVCRVEFKPGPGL